MKKWIFLPVLAVFAVTVSFISRNPDNDDKSEGLTGYYKTYSDYKANKIQKMDKLSGSHHTVGTLYVHFKKDGKVEKIKCKEIWGFVANDELFRIDHNETEDAPCAVVSAGKIVYYESGANHMDRILNPKESQTSIPVHPAFGHNWYLSDNLNSQIFSLSTKKDYDNYWAGHKTKYKDMYDCQMEGYPLDSCAIRYNATHK